MFRTIKKAVSNPKQAMKTFQNRLGISCTHEDYKKFIVLSRSRTGSNMLISMLNSHPSIHAKGEIFNWLRGQSVNYVLDRIYCRYPKYIKAVGFKIFYYHPLDDQSGLVWEVLKNIDLHIIHLKRKNILRTLLSRKIAGLTNVYSFDINKNIGKKDKICHFTEDELKEGFEQTREWEKSFRRMFQSKAMIDVYYEDLVSRPQREFQRITNMLHIEYSEPKTDIKKQNPERISDLIENYQSLKTKFMNTEWACFFED